MRLASLFSGGKDSTSAVLKSINNGHQVVCLVTILPQSEESTLLHFPNIEFTKLQSESMDIPQLFAKSNSNIIKDEIQLLEKNLAKVKKKYKIDGIVHGGILSGYQKKHYSHICESLALKLVSPLWHKDQKVYMKNLIEEGFRFIITSVSAGGLDDSWLGKEVTKNNLETLEELSKNHGFNINFEGGEAETFVIDCPLFTYPIEIIKSKKIWDGYRGRFEIMEANLVYSARKSKK
jgi:ABC transporter with metal-binding/Fe-S-binding domain ATP-binding protein